MIAQKRELSAGWHAGPPMADNRCMTDLIYTHVSARAPVLAPRLIGTETVWVQTSILYVNPQVQFLIRGDI
ncbi:MAG: hypothetical protein A2W68_02540 [Betaproteobacteria bacterium RIFCSPLOWO2_02_64_14]|nr:MAG: hypothetical protein A2W68_02540 [Betaproteobacteria bacterium RIFCSPLOWO2_02_64_14]